jgi:large subunit ribosomal protein L13
MNRTFTNKGGSIERKWYIVDAAGIPVGRLAAQVAQILRGKNKPTFEYNQDCGDYVIVINAAKAVLTGNKKDELIYWHTMWPGGLRNVARGDMLENDPAELISKAIWGMCPKTKLGKQLFSKCKVYADDQHPHEAQNAVPYDISKKELK